MQSEQPFVTLGLPTYNRPDGLRDTLKMIQAQTYQNLEVLVSDNCSPCSKEINDIVEEFKSDARISFTRQKNNLGAMRNFHYLLNQASSNYFMWVADDDVIDPRLIEELMKEHLCDHNLATVISGYDVEDTMLDPPILTEFTSYLKEIPHQDTYTRLKNYLEQPEYQGKIRISWGLAKTKLLKESFDECLAARAHQGEPKFYEIPMELRLISKGNLAVVNECLSHVKLLPTSSGQAELKGSIGNYIKTCRLTFSAYRKAIQESGLEPAQIQSLTKILNKHERSSIVRIVPYYTLQHFSPSLARLIKLVWFKVVGLKSNKNAELTAQKV